MSNNKQRLFEIMGKIDSSFKPKLNEDYRDSDEYSSNSSRNFRDRERNAGVERDDTPRKDIEFVKIKNGGYLRADDYRPFHGERADNNFYVKKDGVYVSKFKMNEEHEIYTEPDDISYAKSRSSDYSRDAETYDDTEKQAMDYAGEDNWSTLSPDERSDIMHQISRPERMNEMPNWGKTRANPAYSHFAVLKNINPAVDGKIVNGWEYKGYDPAELRADKVHYFFQDIKDMQISPKNVNIVTAKYLQKQGTDPYDYKNWYNNRGGDGDEFTDAVYSV